MSRPLLSMYIHPEPGDDELLFAHQLGVDCVYTWVKPEQRTYEFLIQLRQQVERYGLYLYNVGSIDVGKSDQIHLALPGRDEKIAEFQTFVRTLGQAGIHVTTFTWEPTQVWSSTPGETRGALARRVDLDEMRKRPFTHEREYTENEIWDNFTYFIKKMLPVCAEADVRLALHPNDPPSPEPLGGIPCLIHSFEDYQRAFAIADGLNPGPDNGPCLGHYLGMEFCCGCWLEGGAGFGDMLQAIRTFHADGRILIVHFRNVSAPLPQFVETFLDNGYMDMGQVMDVLCQVGYNGTIILDHSPQFAGSYAQGGGAAYAIGYMRAMMNNCLSQRRS